MICILGLLTVAFMGVGLTLAYSTLAAPPRSDLCPKCKGERKDEHVKQVVDGKLFDSEKAERLHIVREQGSPWVRYTRSYWKTKRGKYYEVYVDETRSFCGGEWGRENVFVKEMELSDAQWCAQHYGFAGVEAPEDA